MAWTATHVSLADAGYCLLSRDSETSKKLQSLEDTINIDSVWHDEVIC